VTSRDFCFWLQGYLEVSGATSLDERATEVLKAHLALVFKHEIDPSMGNAQKQQTLNKLHGGGKLLRC
jgi:hypothetical protein